MPLFAFRDKQLYWDSIILVSWWHFFFVNNLIRIHWSNNPERLRRDEVLRLLSMGAIHERQLKTSLQASKLRWSRASALTWVTNKDSTIKYWMQSVLLECPRSTCLIVDECTLIHHAPLNDSSFSSSSEPIMAEDKQKNCLYNLCNNGLDGVIVIGFWLHKRKYKAQLPPCNTTAQETRQGEMVAVTGGLIASECYPPPLLCRCRFLAVAGSIWTDEEKMCWVFFGSLADRAGTGAKQSIFLWRQKNV